jgi:hypothetical protein
MTKKALTKNSVKKLLILNALENFFHFISDPPFALCRWSYVLPMLTDARKTALLAPFIDFPQFISQCSATTG